VARRCTEAGAPCWRCTSEEHTPDHHKGDTSGDPDAGGRAGGLVATDALNWHSLQQQVKKGSFFCTMQDKFTKDYQHTSSIIVQGSRLREDGQDYQD